MSKKLIEAALFMSSRAMTAEEIAKITGVTPSNVKKLLDGLSKEYGSEGKGVEIISNPEGWHMRVKPDILPKVAHLTPYSDLKDGHKRTLALVAYKEPVKQSEVVHMQGNKAYAYIKFLRKKGLIKAEKEGRTSKLMVTKEFERYFGMEKARIKEMLAKGMESEKAREAKAMEEAKAKAMKQAAEIKPEIKAEARLEIRPETRPARTEIRPPAKPLVRPEIKPGAKTEAMTPPTNVQHIETRPAPAAEKKPVAAPSAAAAAQAIKEPRKAEAKTESKKGVIRRPRRTTPAGKIGTRRPVGG